MPKPDATWSSLARNAARGDVFHVIDTETTGASPPGCRVIEVACESYVRGELVGTFETLIDPGVPIPPFITRLTGISTAMARTGLGPTSAMMKFDAYLARHPGHFVAHNAGFDYRFLAYEFELAGLDWPFAGRYCTVRMARHAVPGLGRYNLDRLIEHFGITVVGDRHRAMADVKATSTAFWEMVGLLDTSLTVAVPRAVTPAPVAGGVGPHDKPAGEEPWRRLIADLRPRSVTLAAMLEQHGRLAGEPVDGVVDVCLREPFLSRLEPARRAMLELAITRVFGQDARLHLSPA